MTPPGPDLGIRILCRAPHQRMPAREGQSVEPVGSWPHHRRVEGSPRRCPVGMVRGRDVSSAGVPQPLPAPGAAAGPTADVLLGELPREVRLPTRAARPRAGRRRRTGRAARHGWRARRRVPPATSHRDRSEPAVAACPVLARSCPSTQNASRTRRAGAVVRADDPYAARDDADRRRASGDRCGRCRTASVRPVLAPGHSPREVAEATVADVMLEASVTDGRAAHITVAVSPSRSLRFPL